MNKKYPYYGQHNQGGNLIIYFVEPKHGYVIVPYNKQYKEGQYINNFNESTFDCITNQESIKWLNKKRFLMGI